MLPYQYVPSEINTYLSILLAVLVIVGAVPLGHCTVAAQVTVRDPVTSCLSSMVNDLPLTTAGIVMVALPVSVMICTVPFVSASVMAVELLAENGVST